MLQNIDLLLTASSFMSADSAVRLAKSLRFVEGKTLLIITSPRMQDLSHIRQKICDNNIENVYLFLSKIDNMYACRNWGFIWAYKNGIVPRFYCSMDDDIEFLQDSKDIIQRLDREDYAVMTFKNGSHGYGVNPLWLNGDSMFTRYEDNINCGLPDCLPNGKAMPYFVEGEYQNRLSIMLKKPLVYDGEKLYYTHHYKDDLAKVALRSQDTNGKCYSGIHFMAQKYNIKVKYDANVSGFWNIIRKGMIEHGVTSHHCLYNLEADYLAIYNKIANEYTQV